MESTQHLSGDELEAGVAHVRAAPHDEGALAMIVRRPAENTREVVTAGMLDLAAGLVGDNWQARGSRSTADGAAHPEMQLNLMNARVAALLARTAGRWALAGDQLYVDFDLSEENLPAGTRLAIGEAVIEITAVPHTGCAKFMHRFGAPALKFVNSPTGKAQRWRGVNAKIVTPGAIRTGDAVRKVIT